MAAAAKAHNRWLPYRVAAGFALMLITVVGVGFLKGVPDDSGTWVALLDGALFYGYLLWELNGPQGRAVASYVSSNDFGSV